MENSILNTLEDFELDLKLIENHIEIVQSTFKKKSITIIEKIDLLRDRAIIEFLEKEKLENKMFEERTASLIIDITNKILKKDTIANKIYNSFNVEFNDSNKDSINIISSAPGIIGSLSKREDNTNEYDEVFGYKTVLYNLCSSIEHVFGNVLKDFYINIDQSNRLNNLTINIKDLREINDVKDAEEMLLERKIEDNFYSSFNVWYENIFKEMSLKSIGNEVDFNKVKNFITEMFLIRNLFIHNRGEINDKFKSKTRLNKKLEKGEPFPLTKEFVMECIENTRNLVYYFFYQYCFSKYSNKNEIDEIFHGFNTILLKHIDNSIESVGVIYKLLSNNDKLNNFDKSLSTINYYIFKYNNDKFSDVKNEFEQIDFTAHDQQFIMAKSILLDDYKSYDYIENYLNEVEEDFVFTMYDWPLMKIAMANNENIKKLFKKRINDILDYDKNAIISKEELDYGYEKEKHKKINRNKNKISIFDKLLFRKKK